MSSDLHEETAPESPDRTDGSAELDQREALRLLVNDPAARNYLFAALAAIAMIFLMLFQRGSDLGGALVVIIGAAGLLARWVGAPLIVLVILTYFMVFPFGVPGESFENAWEIEDSRFRVTDVLLVLSVLVYVACHYRVYGLVQQAVAADGSGRRGDDTTTRRPPALIRPSELGVLLGVSTALVVAGQLVWWFVSAVEVVPGDFFPLRFADEGWTRLRSPTRPRTGLTPGTTRFVVTAGLLFFGTLLARLVFGYWRLRTMGPAEGGMILLDAGWAETSRERSRVEEWRVWGRGRAQAHARKAEAGAKKAKPPGTGRRP